MPGARRRVAAGAVSALWLVAAVALAGCFGGDEAPECADPAGCAVAGQGGGSVDAGGALGSGGAPDAGASDAAAVVAVRADAASVPPGAIDAGSAAVDAAVPSNVDAGSVTPPIDGCHEAVVALVIDGSGSMCALFEGSTRWQALRAALVDPDTGWTYRFRDRLRFGMWIFTGTQDPLLAIQMPVQTAPPCSGMGALADIQECPMLITVAPRIGSAAALANAFPATELGGSTPTDKALDAVMPSLQDEQSRLGLPVHLVLVTDGLANDICVGGAGGDGTAQRTAVLSRVQQGASSGITTHVIGLTDGDPALEAHLAEVATAGDPSNPAAAAYLPTTVAELNAALGAIVAAARGCDEP